MLSLSLRARLCLLLVLTLAPLRGALAEDTVVGEGRVPLGAGDAAAIRNVAKTAAVRDAVLKAIKDATALDASDPKFDAIVSEVAKQLRNVQVRDERREGADLITTVEAFVDRRNIKNAIRGTALDKSIDRSFLILAFVDEFLTSESALHTPLKDLTEFKYDAGASFGDKSMSARSANASADSSLNASSAVNSAASAATRLNATGQGGSIDGSANAAASYNAREAVAAKSSSSAQSSALTQMDVEAKSHTQASYRHLVEYQDQSRPTGRSVFMSAFLGNLGEYDLRTADAGALRSKFSGDKPVSLSAMQNSAQMAKFIEFARTTGRADFLMLGSSTVIEGPRNPNTGRVSCVVTVELKAVATTTGEVLSGAGDSMAATGGTIDECGAVAAKRIADVLAPLFASRTLGYWADRAARGRQYVVALKGKSLELPLRMAFGKAIKDTEGASSVNKAESTDTDVRYTVTLKGGVDAQEVVYTALMAQPAFAAKKLDSTVAGDIVYFCLDKCPK